MAIEIHEDVVAGHAHERNDRFGTLYRCWVVTGLDSTNLITFDALVAANIKAGDRYPNRGDYICRHVRIEPLGDQFKNACRIVGAFFDSARRLIDVRVNDRSIMVPQQIDQNGEPLVVGYRGPLTPGGSPTAPGAKFPNPSVGAAFGANGYEYNKVEGQNAAGETSLEFDYLNDQARGKGWFSRLDRFKRKLNSKPWNGGKAREWFFEGTTMRVESAIPTNLGTLGNPSYIGRRTPAPEFIWVTTYRFVRRPYPVFVKGRPDLTVPGQGWDQLYFFRDLMSGRVPTDINPTAGNYPTQEQGNGWVNVKTLPEVDFNDPDLDLPGEVLT